GVDRSAPSRSRYRALEEVSSCSCVGAVEPTEPRYSPHNGGGEDLGAGPRWVLDADDGERTWGTSRAHGSWRGSDAMLIRTTDAGRRRRHSPLQDRPPATPQDRREPSKDLVP